jgi:F0F1-type ATP synthase assembly protein I
MQQSPDQPPNGSDEGLGIREVVGLGGLLVATVVFGTFLGWLADQALSTDPALTLTGLALGIAGGIAGCWVRVRRFLA